MNIKLISFFTLLALVVIFIFQNAAAVEVKFLFWSLQMSRSLLIFILLAVGIAIGIAIGWGLHTYYKSKNTQTL